MFRFISFLLIVMNLSACAWMTGPHGPFTDHANDYLKAKTSTPTSLPAGVSMSGEESYYPVPHPPAPGSLTAPVNKVPPDLQPKNSITPHAK